jgi:hypothetical protein
MRCTPQTHFAPAQSGPRSTRPPRAAPHEDNGTVAKDGQFANTNCRRFRSAGPAGCGPFAENRCSLLARRPVFAVRRAPVVYRSDGGGIYGENRASKPFSRARAGAATGSFAARRTDGPARWGEDAATRRWRCVAPLRRHLAAGPGWQSARLPPNGSRDPQALQFAHLEESGRRSPLPEIREQRASFISATASTRRSRIRIDGDVSIPTGRRRTG